MSMQDTGEGFGVGGDNLQIVWGSDRCEEERRMAGEEVRDCRGLQGRPGQPQVSEPASVLLLCLDGMALGKPDSNALQWN